MICPNCKTKLNSVTKKDVTIDECPDCGGMWLLKSKFDNIKEDRFIRWLDLPLWKEDARHKLSSSDKACPGCKKNLFSLDYHGHDITIEICSVCRGVWLDKGELDKMIRYMEDQVNEETVKDFIKDIGHEAALILKADKDFVSEMKDMTAIMKLLEYRIFSKFPLLSQLAARVPLT